MSFFNFAPIDLQQPPCFQHAGKHVLKKPKLIRSNNCLGVPASLIDWQSIVDNNQTSWSNMNEALDVELLNMDEIILQEQNIYNGFLEQLSADQYDWISRQLEYQWLIPTAGWIPANDDLQKTENFKKNNEHLIRTLERITRSRQSSAMQIIQDTYNLKNPNPKWLQHNNANTESDVGKSPLFKENVIPENIMGIQEPYPNAWFLKSNNPAIYDRYMMPISREDQIQEKAIVDARNNAFIEREIQENISWLMNVRPIDDDDFAKMPFHFNLNDILSFDSVNSPHDSDDDDGPIAPPKPIKRSKACDIDEFLLQPENHHLTRADVEAKIQMNRQIIELV